MVVDFEYQFVKFKLKIKKEFSDFNGKKLFGICVAGLYALSLFVVFLYCYYQSSFFNSYPYDGPFQTLYSLRKISEGQLPGRDFYFFHGNGIPFVHYPIYYMLGKSLFSSYLSESLIHIFFVLAPVQLVVSYYCGRLAGMLSLILWVLISTLDFHGVVVFTSLSVFQPLSSFGIRSISPVVVALGLAYIFHVKRDLSYYYKGLAIALVFSPFAFLLGTEHGVYALFVMYVFVFFMMIWRAPVLKGALVGILFPCLSLSWLILVHLILFGNLSAFYELRNLVNDQTWYYGVYPHLFTIDIREIIFSGHGQYKAYRLYICLTVLTICAAFVAVKRHWFNCSQVIFLSYLFVEACIGLSSNLGYVSIHYASPLLRVLYFASFFLSYELVIRLKQRNII